MTAPGRDLLEGLLARSETLAVARTDGGGRITSANAAMERIAGRRLAGRHASELIAPAQRAAFLNFLAGAGGSWSSLQVGVAPDASGVPQDYRVLVLRDAGEMLLVLEPAASDARVLNAELVRLNDELVSMERDLRRRGNALAGQNERLRELDRLKDEFVSLVSHEFQTPLTSIHGYVGLLLEDVERLDGKHVEFLRVVDRNVERLLRLVGDLLFVAQLDAGGLALETEPVDVAGVVLECVDAIGPAAAAKSVEVTTRLEPVPHVPADRRRVSQLVDNLLTNAVKFTPAGGRVDVLVSEADDRVAVEVRDTGIGIAPEEQPHVFDRFFRASGASRKAISGSGLGLAVAKSISDAHGGTLSVASTEGAGATFRAELPQSPR